MNFLPNELILHILHYIPDHECFHSTCFTRKNWVLNIWPQRKQVLSFNALSELDRYLVSVKPNNSTKTKSANIGSTAGAINASATASHIEERRVGIKVLYDSLEKFTNLHHISLVNCGLNDSILEKICFTFKRRIISLDIAKNRNLSWNNTQKCIMMCENLKKLDISYNFQSHPSNVPVTSDENEDPISWVATVQFPKHVEWVNVSGFLNQIRDFDSLFTLVSRFSKQAAASCNPFECIQTPFIRAFVANHLTDVSMLKPEKCKKLMAVSTPSLIELYNHCLVYLKSVAFTMIYETLRYYPSEEFISDCILKRSYSHPRVARVC